MSGWQTLRLGDVTTKVGSGSTPRGGETAYKASGVPLIRSMNVHFDGFRTDGLAYLDDEQAAALRNVEVQAGDVLLNITGASIGRVTVAPASMHGARVNQHVCIVRPDSRLKASFLRWHLASPSQQRLINSIESGATRQALTKEKILGFDVPLPSLGEQEATVAEIEKQFSRLDEAVAGLRRVKANLKRYKASVLKAAVEGRLVPAEAELARREGRLYETGAELLQRILTERRNRWQGKGKYKEPAAPETSDLPDLPKDWAHSSLDTLLREPLRNGHSAKATDDAKGLRAFTLSAVTEGDFSEANTKRTVAEAAKVADLWAQPGDIFVERSNTPELVGTARLYKGPPNFAFIPDLLIRVRVCKMMLPRYIEIALQSDAARRYFKGRAQGISGTMPKIDQAAIESFAVRIPPLAEQHRIVAEVDRRFSIAREVEAEVEANLRRAQALRQSVLDKAFRSPVSEELRA